MNTNVRYILIDRLGDLVDQLHEDAEREEDKDLREAADYVSELRKRVQRSR
jgi:hypothetical protein